MPGDEIRRASGKRPEYTKSGQVSVNVAKSALDTADYVADGLGLPKPGPIAERVAPQTVARSVGVPTPNEVVQEGLEKVDERLGVSFPPER